jgi:diaminopimelate decarboxylase
MHRSYQYRDGEFYIEEVPVRKIAESVGTPCYIYSYAVLEDAFITYKEAFAGINALMCYSVKANSNLAVLNSFSRLGAGFDIVSLGELIRVKRAGGDPSKAVFSGVGKTEEEMRAAIEAGILFFNVESIEELRLLNKVGIELGRPAPVAIRVNPDIDPGTHPYISTGFKKSKFGIEIGAAFDVYKEASRMEGICVTAIDAHIGSQIFELAPFVDSLNKLVELADNLLMNHIGIEYIDIGGGLGISYRMDEIPPHPKEYADVIKNVLDGKPYKLVLEPGRSLIGNAGMLVTRVLFLKEGTEKKFVIVDAAMNDLIRPAFYESYHEIMTVSGPAEAKEKVDIVGPICESGDFLAKDRKFPDVTIGDLLAVMSAGAYGFTMSSNYNTRPRVPEVLVKGKEYRVVRKRETYDEMLGGETVPDFDKT